MASPIFRINGGAPGVKASVSASGSVTATIDSTDGVRSVEWFIDSTDETTEPGDYTLVQSGSVGQTVDTTALTAGTAAKLRARINGGINLATEQPDPEGTNATAKFFVPTALGREVGAAGEEFESDATYGSTGIINEAVRATGGVSFADVNAALATANAPIDINGQALTDCGGVKLRNDAGTGTIDGLHRDTGDIVRVGENTNALGIRLSVATGAVTDFRVNGTSLLQVSSTGAAFQTAGASNITAPAALTIASGVGGVGNLVLSVAGAQRAELKSTGLEFPNTFDPSISVASLGAGNGRNLALSAGSLTAGAGSGGSVTLSPGTNAGGTTGNVVCVLPFGSGGVSGMFKLYDGTNVFLDAYATAALASVVFDRATTLSVTGAFTQSSTGDHIISVSASERMRVRTTGVEFPADSNNATIAQAASTAPRTLTIRAASAPSPGGGGIDGGHVRLEVGGAGSGTDEAGEVQFDLGLSNGTSGVWRIEAPGAAVGDTIATFQYTDSTATSLWSHNGTLTIATGAFNAIVSDDAFATIATTNAQNVAMFGTGDAGSGAGVLFIGNRSAAPSVPPVGGGILYVEAGALKFMGSGGTITPIAPA